MCSVARFDRLRKLLHPVPAFDLLSLYELVDVGVTLLEVDLLDLLHDQIVSIFLKAHDVEDLTVAGSFLPFAVILHCDLVLHRRSVDKEAALGPEHELFEEG